MVIALSEPCCVFLVDDSKVYWQWFGPTRAGWQRKGSGPLFCFSIVAQRPRVSPPSRPGAVDGLLVPLAHGLMRTHCDEQKRHWYCIMDFATHTSGSGMAECRAPADERRKRWFERDKNTMERNNREANTSATARTSTSGGGHDKKQELLSSSFPFLSL